MYLKHYQGHMETAKTAIELEALFRKLFGLI